MNKSAEILQEIAGLNIEQSLELLINRFPGKLVFSSSFGWEDQVISHIIFSNKLPVKVFTLETGRLFPETYYVWNRTIEKYGVPVHAYYPNT
jgi:phosphoadenosine phosphosulfate reductase